MPSILAKANRYVLRYFNKYGFQDVTLTLLILEPGSTFEMAVELEQYCMDELDPQLNVDMVASSSGYHEPLSEEWRDYFLKLRGTKVFIPPSRGGWVLPTFLCLFAVLSKGY